MEIKENIQKKIRVNERKREESMLFIDNYVCVNTHYSCYNALIR